MKLFYFVLLFSCICWSFQIDDDIIIEEPNEATFQQSNKAKHKVIDEEKESGNEKIDEMTEFIFEQLSKYDPEKSGKILLDDYQLFLEDLYVNSFVETPEEEKKAMIELITEFIKDEKHADYITYDEVKQDVHGPGFTNYFDKKLKENAKKQDEYLQQLMEDAEGELVEEKIVDQKELDKIMKPDL